MMSSNRITKQVEEYITYKQSLGYQITIEANELRRFAKYTCEIRYDGPLTVELAMRWVSLDNNYSRWYMSRRLETIHTFAIYVVAFDQEAQIPQTGVFGKCHGRTSPYIYTKKEILLLINQARELFSPDGIRRKTVTVALGLLWSTGIRVSKLTGLVVKDVCYDKGYLFIRNTKFKKNRLIPLHQTVAEQLEKYAQFIESKISKRIADEYFFVNTNGRRFNTRAFEYAFQLIRPCLLTEEQYNWSGRKPRLFDIRHSFACRTIQRWLENGEDVNQKIYTLSTYMGHVKPEDTYWYLTGTPELLSVAGSKFEIYCGKEQMYEQ